MAKILEPLFTTKSFGVGLGLPVVDKILEQHGGGLKDPVHPAAALHLLLGFPLSEPERRELMAPARRQNRGIATCYRI